LWALVADFHTGFPVVEPAAIVKSAGAAKQ
jgi:hypothetical protein